MNEPIVLPVWIQEFHLEFYQKLTLQVNSKYDFSKLLSALETWRSFSREEMLTDWFPLIHGYLAQVIAYSENQDQDVSAYSIFNIGGFLEKVLKQEIGYYNSQYRVDTDATLISWALSKETTTIAAAQATINFYTKSKILKHVLSLSPIKMSPVSKIEVLQKMFITDNYSNIYDSLNVGNLTIPEGL